MHTTGLRYRWLVSAGMVLLVMGIFLIGTILLQSKNDPDSGAQTAPGWFYTAIDDNRPQSQQGKMGLVFSDINHDGWADVIAGSFVYFNPEGDLEASWSHVELPNNVDVYFAVDVNGNEQADLIGANGDTVYWLEADNTTGSSWHQTAIATVPDTRTQGYEIAQIIDGGMPELVFTRGTDLYYLTIPLDNLDGEWALTHVTSDNEEEDIAAADIDGDGDVDIVAQDESGHLAVWYANPGDGSLNWARHVIGESVQWLDRIALVDVNQDGRLDEIVTEETQDWEQNANIYWFKAPLDVTQPWERYTIATLRSVNSLDAADMDGDGDIDIIIAEHTDQSGKGGADDNVTAWYENQAKGATWVEHIIEIGNHSSHLGARALDLNQDGRRDIISIAWDQYQFVHLWINYTLDVIPEFTELIIDPNVYGDLKGAADLDLDGDIDGIISINGANINQQLVWYENPDWTSHLIATTDGEFTTDFDWGDMDNDGDIDLIVPDGQRGILRWYENPLPDGDITQQWNANPIGENGDWGKDISLVDFNRDGYLDIVARTHNQLILWQRDDEDIWTSRVIFSDLSGEGMEIGDIDNDGDSDIVAAGNWYEMPDNPMIDDWLVHPIFQIPNDNLKFTLVDFNMDNRLDVFVGCSEVPGCTITWYENPADPVHNTWEPHPIAQVDFSHTVQIVDMNNDGWLDLVTGELQQSDDPDNVMVFLNSGDNDHWIQVIVSTNGIHNGNVVDLNGDGWMDILGANFGRPPYYALINNGTKP